MARKKKQRIGFDPLAWMKGGDASTAPAAELTSAPEAGDTSTHTAEADTAAVPHADKSPANAMPAPVDRSASDTGTRVVNFGAALTIPKVAAMHAELQQALESQQAIVLDAAAVEAVDTAGLQLVSVFLREAHERGVTVTWRKPSGILRAGAKRLDLEKALHFPD